VTLEMTEGKGTDLVPGQVSCQVAKTVGELDWDGKTVWSFGDKAPGNTTTGRACRTAIPSCWLTL
jgi:hypothetical protein